MPRVSRRAVMKALGTTAALLPALSPDGVFAFARIQAGNAAPIPKVLPASSFRTLEVLVDAIIPTDERSPGAKEARVADYIDLLLSESEPETGAAVDGRAGGTRQDRDCAIPRALRQPHRGATRRDPRRHQPQRARARRRRSKTFFVMAKQATIRGYYTSEIGIHRRAALQGQPVPAGVRRLPDRRRQGLSALRAESRSLTMQTRLRRSRQNIDASRLRSREQLAAAIKPGSATAGTSSSSAAAPPEAWRRSSWRWPASRCCCSKPAG